MQEYLQHGSIHEAARQNDVDAIKAFVQNGHDVMERDRGGGSPLAWAVRYGQVDAVKCLLDLGADPNERSEQGDTVLHNAVYVNNYDIFLLLVNAGADLNAKDSHGRTIRQMLPDDKKMLELFDIVMPAGTKPPRKNKPDCELRASAVQTRVKQAVDHEIAKLRSEEFIVDLLTLRDALGDAALMSVSDNDYIKHMQFICAQLLSAWVTKLHGGGIDKMMNDSVNWLKRVQYADAPIRSFEEEINDENNIAKAYNSAYGSTATDSLDAMINVMERALTGSSIGKNARSVLHAHLTATDMSYYETVARACGIDVIKDSEARMAASRPAVKSQGPSPSPSGCLLIILSLALGSSALLSAFILFTFIL